VRKIADEQQAETGKTRLTTYSVYDTIKKSNSSLNRKPKKLLEDSIERVLEVIQSDLAGDEESDSVNGDFEGLEDEKVDQVVVRKHRIIQAALAEYSFVSGFQWLEQEYCQCLVNVSQTVTCSSKRKRIR
jgi:hypothetical protein